MSITLCGPLPLFQYFTGWCVMVEVVTTLLLAMIISRLCICMYFYVNNGSHGFWLCRFLFRVEGDTCFFLGVWLATSIIVAMSFSALFLINLTVTTLALTCKSSSFPLYPRVSEVRPIHQGSPLLWVIRWAVFTDEMYLLVKSRPEWESQTYPSVLKRSHYITTGTSLSVSPRAMSGEWSERDQLWIMDNDSNNICTIWKSIVSYLNITYIQMKC